MEGYFKVEFSKLFFTVEFVSERSEEHTSELQSQSNLVCRLLLEKKNEFSPKLLLLCTLPTPQPQRRTRLHRRRLTYPTSSLFISDYASDIAPLQYSHSQCTSLP